MLERREKQGWEAFKNKDRDGFSAIATDDYTAVIADGNRERDLNNSALPRSLFCPTSDVNTPTTGQSPLISAVISSSLPNLAE